MTQRTVTGVLALDLDGTALLPNEQPAPGLLEEVQQWQALGWALAVITARHRKLPLIDLLGARAYTRNYGAQVFVEGQEVAQHTLQPEVVSLALAAVPAGARCLVLTPEQAFVSALCHPPDRPLSHWQEGRDFVKVLAEHPDEEAVQNMAQRWGALANTSVVYERPTARMLIAKGADKGAALREIAAFYDVPLAETVAAGDGHADAPMLACAGTFLRVGRNPLLQAAKRHVSTPDELPKALAQLRAASYR